MIIQYLTKQLDSFFSKIVGCSINFYGLFQLIEFISNLQLQGLPMIYNRVPIPISSARILSFLLKIQLPYLIYQGGFNRSKWIIYINTRKHLLVRVV